MANDDEYEQQSRPRAKRNEQKGRQRKKKRKKEQITLVPEKKEQGEEKEKQEKEEKMYVELLVCHSRVISSYRSRQSRITRIIQPHPNVTSPLCLRAPAPAAASARAHTYDLGVCVVATPA